MCFLDVLQTHRGNAGGDGGQRSPQVVGFHISFGVAAEDEDMELVYSRSGGE